MIVNPGIRRFLGSAIQRLFNSASFYAPLTHTAVPVRAATGTTATFTRATTKTIENNDGYLVTLLAGEIGFPGARRVRNLLTGSSENLTNAAWSNGSVSLVANAALSPRGDATASKVIPTAANANVYQSVSSKLMSGYGKGDAFSWIAVVNVAGSAGAAWFNLTTGQVGTVVAGYTATIEADENGFYRWSLKKDDGTSFALYQILVTDGDNSSAVTPNGTDGIFLWGHQLEDVTAQTTQTAGEYVSVGALDYRSELNRLYLSLPGTAGHYASTPDSVANSITGDIDIRVKAALTDWVAPGAHNMLVSKLLTAGQYSYDWYVQTGSNFMMFRHSTDGTAVVSSPATAAVSFTDGTTGWVRVTRVSSTGAVTFFTSSDGTTWSQLGDLVSSASGEIFDGNTALSVGANATGASPLNGKIFSAQIYNTIGGTTPVVDFNPHRDATTPTGTITSSTTGEVWTINGASSVVRSDYYHGSFVDGVACFDYYYLD